MYSAAKTRIKIENRLLILLSYYFKKYIEKIAPADKTNKTNKIRIIDLITFPYLCLVENLKFPKFYNFGLIL